ncbi:hypothetical protein J7E50_07370 [Pedobacter sp. ISL-68]|uniref:hypothetical protein n=1 Tax=unclassified Pedobacter TaxID=2628915 RepID=UPI001BE6383A|nr:MULTISPECIES: hypothetical protein [unclassified Pedobacter]MBT2560649.1 hypothetical protein [Pedobacter sp. ISL-64]MBT2590028.1 hypothetical protein [Pedobacter sp. ISL-68]
MAKQLTENNNKLARARELLLLGDIDGNDYKTLKLECEENITKTEAKLEEITKKKYTIAQLEPILNDAMFTLTQLFPIFTKSTINDKRRLIGSMLPEKFDFESLQHRTALLSETFKRILLTNNKLERKKKSKRLLKISCPVTGSVAARNSNHFMDELIEIGGFSKILEE